MNPGSVFVALVVRRRVTGAVRRFITATMCGVAVFMLVAPPPEAWADDPVVYEVVSDSVQVANIEYQAITGRAFLVSVALPWRADALVRSARGAPPDGSQVRADWRSTAAVARWVTVRIIYQGKVICQNTMDVGNAACYGVTPRIT